MAVNHEDTGVLSSEPPKYWGVTGKKVQKLVTTVATLDFLLFGYVRPTFCSTPWPARLLCFLFTLTNDSFYS